MAYETYLKNAEAAAFAKAQALSEQATLDLTEIIIYGASGLSLAYAMACSGFTVTIVEPDDDDRRRLCDYLDIAKRNGHHADIAIHVCDTYARSPTSTLIIDARMTDDAPDEAFNNLRQNTPHAIFGRLTSCPLIAERYRKLYHFGLHLAQPIERVNSLEFTVHHNSHIKPLLAKLALKLEKLPIITSLETGAISPRLLARYYAAADDVFMDGATPWDIDDAMTDFGFATGPYEAEDLAGLDHGYQLRSWQRKTSPELRAVTLIDRMLELGKLGQKTGAGWYRYPGGGGKVEDPIVADLAIEESYFAGTTRTDYADDAIKNRLLLAMINEVFLYAETLACSSEQIDLASIRLLGFPRNRGGLMSYADKIGAKNILDEINVFIKEDFDILGKSYWQISPLITKAAESDKPLSSMLTA